MYHQAAVHCQSIPTQCVLILSGLSLLINDTILAQPTKVRSGVYQPQKIYKNGPRDLLRPRYYRGCNHDYSGSNMFIINHTQELCCPNQTTWSVSWEEAIWWKPFFNTFYLVSVTRYNERPNRDPKDAIRCFLFIIAVTNEIWKHDSYSGNVKKIKFLFKVHKKSRTVDVMEYRTLLLFISQNCSCYK